MPKLERVEGKTARYDENWRCSYDPDFEYHGIELDFWAKLDTDLYNWTLKFPFPIGTFFRILFSILGMNHRNPVPISSSHHVAHLWWNRPQWQRYILWRVRNPWEDLRKLYLGFGWAFYSDKLWRFVIYESNKVTIDLFAPYKIPVFPHIELLLFDRWFEIDIGFKKRGCFSLSAREK